MSSNSLNDLSKVYLDRVATLNTDLSNKDIKVMYLHSDIVALERVDILRDLRLGKYDVLVGVNLLREGLDLPEVSLVAVLDADKEGYLRSETSLIQIFGRAARNLNGHVILYADQITNSMERAIGETSRRRSIQMEYNKKNNITPKTIKKNIDMNMSSIFNIDYYDKNILDDLKIQPHEIGLEISKMQKQMKELSTELKFEEAAMVRDKIKKLKKLETTYSSEIE